MDYHPHLSEISHARAVAEAENVLPAASTLSGASAVLEPSLTG